jgi:ribosomal protein S18 acetylase RimI-like enzyme
MRLSQLCPLVIEKVEEAATLAAHAFLENPSYGYLFEDVGSSRDLLSALTWLFTRNIRLRLSAGRCAFASDSGKMVCFFMLQYPNSGEISTFSMIMSGLLTMPFVHGWTCFFRLLEIKKYHENLDSSIREKVGEKYVMLERMVVSPEYQGQGIGRQCLSAGLQEAADAGLGMILSTLSVRNVAFYSRLGFKEIHRDSDYPYYPTTTLPRLQEIDEKKEEEKVFCAVMLVHAP